MGIVATPKPAYVILCFCIFMGVLISTTHVLHLSTPISEFIYRQGQQEAHTTNKSMITESPKYPLRQQLVIPLNCTVAAQNQTRTCPRNYPTSSFQANDPAPSSCPDYFRWIHEDLRPWKTTGITEEMIARAPRSACFRMTIVDGRVYIERIKPWWQSRAELNIWGILQLLRRYPGKLPDLVLMFDCEDRPAIFKKSLNGTAPPPVFTYCADDRTLDIVFPDWSFWGWPEIDIKPWESLSKELEESNKKIKWSKRKPYAYWKGNPNMAKTRQDLMKCNVSDAQDWKARLYKQDWRKEVANGFKESNLARECTHRYKIYIEGNTWSVSGKYILACDSLTLIVTPHYYDFFTRGLTPLQNYWPVNERTKCKSIKYAVEWGESHKEEALKIGRSSTKLILEDLKMDYVYDYMFHLLNEYAKLLKFKPTVPPPQSAVEYCSEAMACEAQGIKKNFMMDSLEKGPALTNPCTMPPPYNTNALSAMMKQRRDSIKKVEKWENSYW